jgi:hypothetical protein
VLLKVKTFDTTKGTYGDPKVGVEVTQSDGEGLYLALGATNLFVDRDQLGWCLYLGKLEIRIRDEDGKITVERSDE